MTCGCDGGVFDTPDGVQIITVGEQGPPGPPGSGGGGGGVDVESMEFNGNGTATMHYANGVNDTFPVSGTIDGGTF